MTAAPAPVLDPRNADDVLAELVDNVRGYSAHWRPQPGAAGYALLQVLGRFCNLVIASLNGAVDKGELAFLDAMGIDLLPPQAARVPLVFTIAPDSPVDPPLPQGTEVAASPAPVLGSSLAPPPRPTPAIPKDPVVFATDEEIAIARARLVALYSTYPDVDQYADHSAALATGFSLYDNQQPVVHELYLGHDSLLSLDGDVDVRLEFALGSELRPSGTTKSGKRKQPKGLELAWEYLADDWIGFDSVDDHTSGLALAGEINLHKRGCAASTAGTVHGTDSFWLRARLKTPLPLAGSTKDQPRLPEVDTIRLGIAVRKGGITPDTAFADGLRLDTSKDFAPFGVQPDVSSSFLVACDDAFKREGARIGISLSFTPGVTVTPSSDLVLFWEYSVAPGVWKALGGTETEFRDKTADLTTPTTLDPPISFLRPDDWAKVAIDGETHFWLRVRIAQGNFGGPTTYSVESDASNWKVVASNVPAPPMLKAISFSYTYQLGPVIPDHCITLNGFEYDDFSDACRWGRTPFQPFAPLPDRFAAVYFGFDRALPVGLVSLYLDIPGSGGSSFDLSPYQWEYRSPDGWAELTVLDETSGFRRTGLVQLIGQPDAVSAPGPAGETWWIRARLRDPGDPDPSPVGFVAMNTVWATQRRTVSGEVLGRGDGTRRQVMLTQHTPVLDRELLEVREWGGAGREWESLFADLPRERLRYEKDPRGSVTAVWVTWERQPHLYSSGPNDRHYVLERSSGLVRFGNSSYQVMVPPPGAPVMLSYDYGGGVDANVAAGTITQLHSGVPFVAQVQNPVAAAGGTPAETIDEVRRRGPQRLRNAGRSVATSDYEWLAYEASPEVAIARCLPATGPDGAVEPGWVTVVIVPDSTALQPQPSQQLLARVEQALSNEAPAAIDHQVRLVGPEFRLISVVAELVPVDPGESAQLEERLVERLDDFLHPVRGGRRGGGWEFGQTVRLSDVVEVVLDTPGVRSAPHVALVSDTEAFGEGVPVPENALPSPGKHLLKLEVSA